MERNALDLPEIRTLLGSHLSLASLYSCVLVNKDWHDTFLRHLWATFYFGPANNHSATTITTTTTATNTTNAELRPPERATVEKYAHLIQNLVVLALTPTYRLDVFKDTPLTSLKELHLAPTNNSDTKNIPLLDCIFRQNPGLRVVEYNEVHGRRLRRWLSTMPLPAQEQEEEFTVMLNSCREMTDLTVRYVEFEQGHWEPFRQLCATRLRRLVFYFSVFLEGVDWDAIPMPHLQELDIRCAGRGTAVPGLKTILQCPSLRTLRWSAERDPDPSSIRQILTSCPRLEALELQEMVLLDEVIAYVLKSMAHPATEIILPKSKFTLDPPRNVGFGWKAFDALARRHLTERLVVLDMGQTSGFVGSGMVLRVLYSCVGLREIGACRVLGSEICECSQAKGRWVCRGLEVFKVKVVFEVSDPQLVQTHQGVFHQFAQLTRLRVLNVGTRITANVQQRMHSFFSTDQGCGLQLKLEYGLAQLEGLTRLESISVTDDVPQRLGREDVEWMRQSWRGLKVVEGELCPERAVSEAVRKVLTMRASWRKGQEKAREEEERWLGVLDGLEFRVAIATVAPSSDAAGGDGGSGEAAGL